LLFILKKKLIDLMHHIMLIFLLH